MSPRTVGTYGCVGREGVTEALGAGQLCPSLPPLPAQEADLVGHHTLLELVLRCHRAAHVTGAALQSSNFHHVVHEGQREAQAAQDVRVLLLLEGCQGRVTERADHLSCASNPTQLTEKTPYPPTPLHLYFGPNSAWSLHWFLFHSNTSMQQPQTRNF